MDSKLILKICTGFAALFIVQAATACDPNADWGYALVPLTRIDAYSVVSITVRDDGIDKHEQDFQVKMCGNTTQTLGDSSTIQLTGTCSWTNDESAGFDISAKAPAQVASDLGITLDLKHDWSKTTSETTTVTNTTNASLTLNGPCAVYNVSLFKPTKKEHVTCIYHDTVQQLEGSLVMLPNTKWAMTVICADQTLTSDGTIQQQPYYSNVLDPNGVNTCNCHPCPPSGGGSQ